MPLELGIGGEKITISKKNNIKIFKKVLEGIIVDTIKWIRPWKIFPKKYSWGWHIISPTNQFNSNQIGAYETCVINMFDYEKWGIQSIWICCSFKLSYEIPNSRETGIYPTRANIKWLSESLWLLHKYEELNVLSTNIPYEYNFIDKFIKWLAVQINDSQKWIIKIHTFTPTYLNQTGLSSLNNETIISPTYYFYWESRGSWRYEERLRVNKPYSYWWFQNKPIRIWIICPKQFEGICETFANKVQRWLEDFFHLRNITFSCHFIADASLEKYKEELYAWELTSSYDLLMMVVNEEHRELLPNQSPYYYMKAKCIGQKIPTQQVQVKSLQDQSSLIINNICLNIYSKIGGTARAIEKINPMKAETIIGIGSSIDDEKKTILWIANVFDYNGRFIAGDCTPITEFNETYIETLERCIDNIIQERLESTKSLRIIFHIYKPASKKYEIKAIEKVIEKYNSSMNISYCLVHISEHHNFRLFGNLPKWTYINISPNTSLLQVYQKSNIPLFITIDRRSTFSDIYYISKQIFWFAHLSSRSFMPAKNPITTTYPSLIANITDKLKMVENWDVDILKWMTKKLWFL